MPPKKQVTEEMILEKAFALTREHGFDSISARALARELNCSTQPIYQMFSDMAGLKIAVIKKSAAVMMEFIARHKDPALPEELGFILGYVRFAGQEEKLFQLIFTSGANGPGQSFAAWGRMRFDRFDTDMIVYANGIIMMSAFQALDRSWEEKKKMIVRAYEKFHGVRLPE